MRTHRKCSSVRSKERRLPNARLAMTFRQSTVGLKLPIGPLGQIGVDDLDQFLGRKGPGIVLGRPFVDHVFANMVFDYLRDEAVQSATA